MEVDPRLVSYSNGKRAKCPHGVKYPDNPAVMPDCDGCMETQEKVRQEMYAGSITTPAFPEPELPRWMRH